MLPRTPPPADHGIRTDHSTRLVDDGRLLIGGNPPHTRALSTAQAGEIIRWLGGAAPTDTAGRALAADLIAAGMAHPLPPAPYSAELPSFTTVEVHGASSRARALADTETDVIALLPPGARPDRLENALAHFTDPSVAAVVPRVLPDRTRPLGYVETAVAAVAADLLGLDRGTDPGPVLPWGHTTPEQAPPGPAGEFITTDPLCSVPALLVRRRALGHAPRTATENEVSASAPGAAPPTPDADTTRATGQDGNPCPDSQDATTVPDLSRTVPAPAVRYAPELRENADIDLLWSLTEAGWSVRHEPRSRVRVPVPTDPLDHLRACHDLGAAAGPLARRRGRGPAGPELSWTAAAGAVLLLTGRPGAALLVGALGCGTRTLTLIAHPHGGEGRVPLREAARLAGTDLLTSAHTGARTLRTTWWPVAVALGAAGVVAAKGRPSGKSRRRTVRRTAAIAAALLLPHTFAWHRRRGTSPVDPVTWTVLRTAGDAARSLGTWRGAARARTLAPLLPRLRPRRLSAWPRSAARADTRR